MILSVDIIYPLVAHLHWRVWEVGGSVSTYPEEVFPSDGRRCREAHGCSHCQHQTGAHQYVYCCLSCVRYQEVSHERFHLISFTICTICPNVCCQVAADCISYLKDQRIGTCCFIPLDNISPKPVQERLRSLGPKYRLCVDLVECDDIYK